VPQSSIDWGNLKASELRELARPETVVIVPVAATEQHGPHLPVATDRILGHEVARRAARIIQADRPALVTDPVWTGLSEHHMAFGGTFTLDFPAFLGVLRGVVGSLQRHGFERVLLLNSHGGNVAALRTVVEELTRDLGMRRIATCTYWLFAADILGPMLETQKGIRHACEAETSMMLALHPELVDSSLFEQAACPDHRDQPGFRDDGSYRWESFAEKTPSGTLGDPRPATAEKGERMLAAAAERLAERLIDPAFWGDAA